MARHRGTLGQGSLYKARSLRRASRQYVFLFINHTFLYSNIPDISVDDVKLQLGKEDDEDRKRGVVPSHDVSPTVFLSIGLELEEQQ